MIVKADGVAVAACKSCSLDVNVDEIEIASPTDGKWRHVLAGRMSWKVSTSHLVECLFAPDGHIMATAAGSMSAQASTAGVKTDGGEGIISGYGLNMFHVIRNTLEVVWYGEYSLAHSDDLVSQIEEASSDSDMVVLVSYGGFGMNANLKQAIETYFHVTLPSIPTGQQLDGAFAVIGKPSDNSPGIFAYNPSGVATVHAEMFLNEGEPSMQTPMKTLAQKVGKNFTLEISLSGFPYDKLTGTALCHTFNVVGTDGNLMQGSFSWRGNGPLE